MISAIARVVPTRPDDTERNGELAVGRLALKQTRYRRERKIAEKTTRAARRVKRIDIVSRPQRYFKYPAAVP